MKARRIKIFYDDEVYPPSEDTLLLLDAISISPGSRVLEIGTGSAYIAIHCALEGAEVWATDISQRALRNAMQNALANNVKINFIHSDLFEKVEGRFDVIIFNPPYLPTEEWEKIDGEFNLALDGGADGCSVIRRFLTEAWKFLNPNGVIYLLYSSHNTKCIEDFKKIYNVTLLRCARYFFEELFAAVLQPAAFV